MDYIWNLIELINLFLAFIVVSLLGFYSSSYYVEKYLSSNYKPQYAMYS